MKKMRMGFGGWGEGKVGLEFWVCLLVLGLPFYGFGQFLPTISYPTSIISRFGGISIGTEDQIGSYKLNLYSGNNSAYQGIGFYNNTGSFATNPNQLTITPYYLGNSRDQVGLDFNFDANFNGTARLFSGYNLFSVFEINSPISWNSSPFSQGLYFKSFNTLSNTFIGPEDAPVQTSYATIPDLVLKAAGNAGGRLKLFGGSSRGTVSGGNVEINPGKCLGTGTDGVVKIATQAGSEVQIGSFGNPVNLSINDATHANSVLTLDATGQSVWINKTNFNSAFGTFSNLQDYGYLPFYDGSGLSSSNIFQYGNTVEIGVANQTILKVNGPLKTTNNLSIEGENISFDQGSQGVTYNPVTIYGNRTGPWGGLGLESSNTGGAKLYVWNNDAVIQNSKGYVAGGAQISSNSTNPENLALSVENNDNPLLIVRNNGNVGIGTSASYPLDVNGTIKGGTIRLEGDGTQNSGLVQLGDDNWNWKIGNDYYSGSLQFIQNQASGSSMTIQTDGKVGIGTGSNSLNEQLEVAGNIKATGLVINDPNNVDKIFTTDYNGNSQWVDKGTIGIQLSGNVNLNALPKFNGNGLTNSRISDDEGDNNLVSINAPNTQVNGNMGVAGTITGEDLKLSGQDIEFTGSTDTYPAIIKGNRNGPYNALGIVAGSSYTDGSSLTLNPNSRLGTNNANPGLPIGGSVQIFNSSTNSQGISFAVERANQPTNFIVKNDGKVGIGTDGPLSNLHVGSKAIVYTDDANTYFSRNLYWEGTSKKISPDNEDGSGAINFTNNGNMGIFISKPGEDPKQCRWHHCQIGS